MKRLKEVLNYEINVKHFGFTDCEPDQFYLSKWSKNRSAYVTYRVLIFIYAFAWIVGDIAMVKQPDYWVFPTNWSEVTECLYFLVSMLVVIYGYLGPKEEHTPEQGLKWFHKISWILFTTALSVALAIDLPFWLLLAGKVSPKVLCHPLNIHKHVVNYLLMLIDLFISDIPIRIMHFIYPLGYGLVYTVFITVVWACGHTAIGYDDLNSNIDPGLAALMTMLASFVLLPLLHILVHFWMHKLRECIYRKCFVRDKKKEDKSESKEIEVKVEVNEAFEIEKE